jgi:hypothetical protein
MTEDFRIELTHTPERLLSWTWATYDPRDVNPRCTTAVSVLTALAAR